MLKLKFSRGNAKLDALEKIVKGQVWTFSLLSGHTCPYAKDCLSKAEVVDGKRTVVDGPYTLWRCFSASQEALFTNVYNSRKHNTQIVQIAASDIPAAAEIIANSLPRKAKVVRIHVGGDFQTKAYFQAWLLVAHNNPNVIFYAYTKSLPFWKWAADNGIIPDNFVLTASYGGWKDRMIGENGFKAAKVVMSEDEAKLLGLQIDHDDSLAVSNGKSFALLLHGVQPKGSKAADALKKLNGKGTYKRKGKGKS